MPSYHAPVADSRFLIEEVLQLPRYAGLPGFDQASGDMVEAILTEAARFVEEVLFPLNQIGDREGCTRHEDGSVTTPTGFRTAYDRFREAGWGTLAAPEAFGGQGLPHLLAMAVEEYVVAANMAFAMYPGLTSGAVSAILAKGSDEQKALYAPPMIEGRWSGTMNLTEPQCGTDLGLIRTRAEPRGDGSYAITGTKIFISSGEHDLTENIIHLVLARTPDAPPGVKGISLFIVPKYLVAPDGTLGERNTLGCGSIEHKMGIHGNSTCVMNYDGATGYLLGEENRGLAAMFIMMNAARLGVGLQGLGVGEVAYQNAVAYARERRQGRALTGPQEPQAPADPLLVHPDVRRMLMEGKALTEGLRALMLWAALQVDLAHRAQSEEERRAADDLLGLLTPVIKGYGTDKGFEIAVISQQVYGGHGYIAEWGMEQFVRDARIAMIYEGTNGVQAMDLVGRKLAKDGGRALQSFLAMLDEEIGEAKGQPTLADFAARLERAVQELKAATAWLMQNAMADPDNLGAAATPYLHLMGLVAVGLMWLRQLVAVERLADGGGEAAAGASGASGEGAASAGSASGASGGAADPAFLQAKRITARFYAERLLPDAGALRHKIEGGAEALMALTPEQFVAA